MKIGVPKEVKIHEYRVGLTPCSVRELVKHGHSVYIETKAGAGIGISDDSYVEVGAHILSDPDEVYSIADLIVKVKEPQPEECSKLKKDQILFTFLHLAAEPAIADAMLYSGVTGIAYETVTDKFARLPLLAPMSEVAGRIAVQMGAACLERAQGGKGILLGGIAGVSNAQVFVIGGGMVGTHAIKVALGMGANVSVVDRSLDRLRQLQDQFGSALDVQFSTQETIERLLKQADLVIGAVLIPGAQAPKIVSNEMVSMMQQQSVIVDVAIDQGGCFATSKPTTFDNPTFVKYGVIHKCVTNLPGNVPRTSTFALNNATLPFVIELANKGVDKACIDNQYLRDGLNIYQGFVTHRQVADSLGHKFKSPMELLSK